MHGQSQGCHRSVDRGTGRPGIESLGYWEERESLWDTVTDSTGTRRPFRPDAFFTVKDPRKPADAQNYHFFLEADHLQKESHTQFGEKIPAAWEYIKQGRHTDKFKIKYCRVLTITRTEKRAQNLNALVKERLPERHTWKYSLFTSLENLSLQNPSSIFDEVYLSPRSSVRQPLVPKLNTLQKEQRML